MIDKLTKYLGQNSYALISSYPFNDWVFDRTVDEDLPEKTVNYVESHGEFSMVCDSNEKIRAIFLKSSNFDEEFIGFPFSYSRDQVLSIMGAPSKSGAAYNDPILGKYGPWDRYDLHEYSMHVGYRADEDKIESVTLIRADVVP